MKTGAIIAAAGPFKWGHAPMLNNHKITLVRRIIMTFRKAGVSPIVVVHGAGAQAMPGSIEDEDVLFACLEDSNQLADTARVGWQAICGKCEKLFFTRADIPQFSVATLQALEQSGAEVAIPLYYGNEGHPMLVEAQLFGRLLEWSGEGGIREAIRHTRCVVETISVQDEGILHTQGDSPLQLEGWKHSMRLQVNGGNSTITPSVAAFFSALDRIGSVEAAAALLGINAKQADAYITRLEKDIGCPVVDNAGEKPRLTHAAREFIALYERFHEQAQESVKEIFARYFSGK